MTVKELYVILETTLYIKKAVEWKVCFINYLMNILNTYNERVSVPDKIESVV